MMTGMKAENDTFIRNRHAVSMKMMTLWSNIVLCLTLMTPERPYDDRHEKDGKIIHVETGATSLD